MSRATTNQRRDPDRDWRQRVARRAFDLVGAGVGILATAPIMASVAVAVRAKMGGPVLFKQRRPGLHGKIFTIYKFRTMRDAPGLSDAERLTPLGQFLRRTSLDELPELFNVLLGDMSLVGPRPLIPEYLERYTPEQARRHLVKPGITGWAAVNGRNANSWEEKFRLDCWYVDNQSLWLDLRILWRTVGAVMNSEGISHPGDATMPVFMGTQNSAAASSDHGPSDDPSDDPSL